MITQLSALFKVGKTTLLAHLLRALEADGEFCGKRVSASKILYVSEEGEDGWARRRDELGLKDHIDFIVNPFLTKPDKKQWLAYVAYLKRKQKENKYDVIVLDTISNLWCVKDENSAGEVQEALMPLRDLIHDTALPIIHHLRKSDGDEGTGGRGSGAFGGFVDIILECRRYRPDDKTDCRRVLTGYGRPREVPSELVIELTDKGYKAVGEKGDIQLQEMLVRLDAVIGLGAPGLTRDEIHEKLKENDGKSARRETITDALKRGVEEKRWHVEGKKPERFFKVKGDEEIKN
jgi:hypothetical protein